MPAFGEVACGKPVWEIPKEPVIYTKN
jgi:hypothetical protein